MNGIVVRLSRPTSGFGALVLMAILNELPVFDAEIRKMPAENQRFCGCARFLQFAVRIQQPTESLQAWLVLVLIQGLPPFDGSNESNPLAQQKVTAMNKWFSATCDRYGHLITLGGG